MSLVSEIKIYLKARPYAWINGGKIEDFGKELGYKASHADRRGRDIVDPDHHSYDPSIESRLNEKRCIEYRYNPDKDPLAVKLAPKPTQSPLFPVQKTVNARMWM